MNLVGQLAILSLPKSDPARQHTKAEFQNIKGLSKYFPLWHVDGHVSPSPKAAAAGRARRGGIEPGTRGL